MPRSFRVMMLTGVLMSSFAAIVRAEDGWVDLLSLDAWKGSTSGWSMVGGVALDATDPRKLEGEPGSGVMFNGPDYKKSKNLVSHETFGDVEIHAEFVVPKGSNSGIKFQAVYEVQIFDSFGVKTPRGTDSGSVYPRSELKPKYHKIDDGHPPLVIAARPPGEWQEMDLIFKAPRFDKDGNKIASARISAKLNGQVVQDDLEVTSPTGNAWHDKEKPAGPILIQSDHGPVAFRNLRARRLDAKP